MLGHVLFDVLSREASFDVYGTAKEAGDYDCWLGSGASARILAGIDAFREDAPEKVLSALRPQAVVNCIGTIKQSPLGSDPVTSITVNALFPNRLAVACKAHGVRLLHVSTDCVFRGTRGNYSELDPPDAADLYGRTKLLGEVAGAGCLTLRTSLVGHELRSRRGLVEWFLHETGPVEGFERAIFSGLTCLEFSLLVKRILLERVALTGLYHVAGVPIAKCDLLGLLAREYGLSTVIRRSDRLVVDRSLDASAFTQVSGYKAPPWQTMIEAMRRHHVAFAYAAKRAHCPAGGSR